MRIELQVVGGFAALNVPGGGPRSPAHVVETEGMAETELERLRGLVAAAAGAAAGSSPVRPDAASHRITITDRGRSTTIVARDGAVPPEVAKLISWVKRNASVRSEESDESRDPRPPQER